MLFEIRHQSRYHYSAAVRLGPQWLRFHPRDDGSQRLLDLQLETRPDPIGRNLLLDLAGNRMLWFDGETDRFEQA